MTDNATEALRSLVTETTALLRDLMMDQGKQVSEIKDSLSDVRNLTALVEKLYTWKEQVDSTLIILQTQQAVDENMRKQMDKDEIRAYEERKDLTNETTKLRIEAAKTVGLILEALALIGLILEKVL